MRKKADDIFNEMERRVTSLGNTLRGNISENIVTCDDLIIEMCSMKEKLLNTDNKDECHVFIDVVEAENYNNFAKEEINKIYIDNSESLPAVEEFNSTPDTVSVKPNSSRQSTGVGQF
jgi:hypothetical protein